MKLISMFAFPLMWVAAVPVIVAAQVVNTTTASSTMYDSKVEPITCAPNEFTCDSGFCVPSSFVCDGYDDCGNMEDELAGCRPECERSDEILNCFTHIRLATDNETPGELNFTLDHIEQFYVTGFGVYGNISANNLLRFNISTATDTLVLVKTWNAGFHSRYIYLKLPLHINPGESFTISVEITRDIHLQGWTQANLTIEEIVGIELLHSCKDSTDCFRSFNNASDVYAKNCSLTILERFLQEKYKRCVDICEAENLKDPIAGMLSFPTTNITQTATSEEVCESSTREDQPRATRFCTGDKIGPGSWEDPALNCFNINHCNKTDVFEYLQNINVTEYNVEAFSRLLAIKTDNTDLDTDDLVTVTNLLEKITNVNSSSKEVTNNVVEIVDNVRDLKRDTYIMFKEVTSRILRALERQLINLHRGGNNVSFSAVRSSIGVLSASVDHQFFSSGLTVGLSLISKEQRITENLTNGVTRFYRGNPFIKGFKASITLPKSLLSEIEHIFNLTDKSDQLPVTFIIYRKSHFLVSNETSEEQKSEMVESLVVSATIQGKRIENLKNPVVARFRLPPLESTSKDRRCVFWNVSLANGTGAWSSQGCELIDGPDCIGEPIVECICNHLAQFAVLVDLQADGMDVQVIIGCIFSIISLLITVVANLAKKNLRAKQNQQIFIYLCLTLLGLYFSFIIGINMTMRGISCIIFGAVILFFCVSSVAWLSVETTSIYTNTFKLRTNNYMKKAAVVAWGIPLVLVVVLFATKPSDYACEYCFPVTGTVTFYVGVVATISVMVVYNMIMLIFVIKSLTCQGQFSEDDSSLRKETTKRIQNAAFISVLLILSWLFGFLAMIREQFIFSLLFLIFNLLTALCIFLLFCVRNQEVRSEWSKTSFPTHESQAKDGSGIGLTAVPGKQAKENTESESPTSV